MASLMPATCSTGTTKTTPVPCSSRRPAVSDGGQDRIDQLILGEKDHDIGLHFEDEAEKGLRLADPGPSAGDDGGAGNPALLRGVDHGVGDIGFQGGDDRLVAHGFIPF